MAGTQNLFRRFLSVFSGKLLTTLIAVFSTPLIARLLGPGEFGDYAVLLSIFSLYMIPISSGVTEGVQKFVAESRDAANWREHVISFYLVLAVAIVSLGALVLFVFTALGFAETVFGSRFTGYFYLLAVFVVISQLRALSYHTVLGFGIEAVSESLNVVKKLATVLVGIGLVVAGFGVAGMLAGHIVANLVVALAAGYVIARRVSVQALFQRPPSFPYRELLSFNGLNILLVFLVMSLFHIDVVMIRTFVDSEATGYYKAALSLAEFVWVAPLALQVLLLHSSSSLWSEGREEAITELAAKVTRFAVLLVILLAIGLGVLADRFVPLYYGEEFTVATLPLRLLLPGVVGFAAARPLQAISQGSGQIRTLIVAIGGAAGLNLVLNALLIPRYAMVGAAAATSIGYGSMFVFLVWAARRIGYYPLADFRADRIAATAVLSAPVILFAERLIDGDILALVVVPSVGLLTYGWLAVATRAVDPDEVLAILEKVPEPVGSALAGGFSWIR